MKFKYFLRGLGVGIVFATIVLLVAYNGKPSRKMSDEDIIKRAKELGMVEQENYIKELLTTEKDKNVPEADKNQTSEDKQSSEDTQTKEDKQTKEDTQTTEATTEEETTTEKKTTNEEKTTEGTTEKVTPIEDTGSEFITIAVERGDTSYTVCQKLQAAGIVKDAAELDTYLVENGYANRIRIDSYQFKIGMDFHDIAEIITKSS